MPLTPAAPSPVVAFSKGLINFFEDHLIDPYRHLYVWIAGATAVLDMQWRYVVVRWSRATPATTAEDYAQIGFNVTNITGGDLDKTWTTQDYIDVANAMNEWVTAIMQYLSSNHTLIDVRFYLRQFNDKLPLGQPVTTPDPATGKPYKRFAKQGPPQYTAPMPMAGPLTTGAMPYQDALSVTFKTPAPKHWGRVYIPGVAQTALDANGRWIAGVTSFFANQTAELIDDLATKQFQLVVPTTQIDGKFSLNLQHVSQVQVDDVPDVIRRRRAKQAARRSIGAPLP